MRPFPRVVVGAVLLSSAACAGHSSNASDPALHRLPTADEIASREQTADQQVHHVLNRLAFGARPGDYAAVRAMGVDVWIARQLDPDRISDGATDAFLGQFHTLGKSGEQLMSEYPPPGFELAKLKAAGGTITAADSARFIDRAKNSYAFLGEISTVRVARSVMSERQLQEVMVDFWENHFNVFAGKDRTRYFLQEFDANVIRPRAMGKFRDLLGAVAKSPAMLYYLDNWQSVADSGRPTLVEQRRMTALRVAAPGRKQNPAVANLTIGQLMDRGLMPKAQEKRLQALPADRLAEVKRLTPAQAQQRLAAFVPGLANRKRGLNENYARELMELHTLGVDGGYTQHDVTEVARALTGWTISRGANGGDFLFRPEQHDAAAKMILGKAFPDGRGVEEGEEVLDMLARSPATAKFIATKLARRFVSDSPPADLVARAADTFRRTDGDIRETLRTIVTSNEFFASAAYRSKVKSPYELVASTLRAMGAVPDSTPRYAQLVSRLGQPIFGHLAPNGYPETGDAWMNTGAILNRINFGLAAASGRVPGVKLADWPATKTLGNATREQQVDGIIAELFGGGASTDTREVLLTGSNPFLQSRAAADAARSDSTSMTNAGMASTPNAGTAREQRQARVAERQPLETQQARAGREAVKPAGTASLTQSIGNIPQMGGFNQIVGLALGAPEFQRR